MAHAVAAPVEVAVRRTCRGCSEDVLLVRLGSGIVVALDAHEVMPPLPCPLCRTVEGRGHTRGTWCWRCGGTNVVGEPLPQPGVALDPEGKARVFRGRRHKGESVHRPHACPIDEALRAARAWPSPIDSLTEDADMDPSILDELESLPLRPLDLCYTLGGVPDQQEQSMDTITVPKGTIRPTIELLGADSNAGAVMGAARRALRKAGNEKPVLDSYSAQAMSGDYDHLLRVTMAFCEVE